jgi:choice-of-anchor A domain-containing protein
VRLLIQNGGTETVIVAGNGVDVGAKLTMYVASSTFSIGAGKIDGGRAANLSYYGLPSNTSINFSGNGTFTGTIYAPNAAVTLSGSGGNDYDIVGSVIAKTVTINGHFQFHFDEDLLTSGPARGYTAVHWSEI